jgi:predicted Zn finger-like uncharacterized protein
MLVGCPKCKTRFRLDEVKSAAENIVLRCGCCRTIFRIKGVPAGQGPDSGTADKKMPGRLTVLLANESRDFCAAVERVLSCESFEVISIHDGKAAFDFILEHKPAVVVVDVALPSMYGFEICERIRDFPALSVVKTILIASIFDKTRYKREPVSLYGADDYIEKHHIPDSLAAKINRLVYGQSAVEPAAKDDLPVEDESGVDPEPLTNHEMERQEAVREEIRIDEEVNTVVAEDPTVLEAHAKARRFARIIVSDIALYNQKKVEEGIRTGTFFDLLGEDVMEGRRLYENRVPPEVRLGTSYLEDAFNEFISRKNHEMSAN